MRRTPKLSPQLSKNRQPRVLARIQPHFIFHTLLLFSYTRLSAMAVAVVASLLDTSLLGAMAVHTCRRSGLESRSRAKQGKVSSQLPTPRPNRVSRKGLP